MGIGTSQLRIPRKTTFREFAKERYIREEVKNLARTTQVERVRELRADGPIMKFFGDYRLDEISTDTLTVFWNQAVIGRERTVKTGRNYLDVVSGVLGYAHELKLLSENPVPSYRQILRRKLRTKKGRSQSNMSRDIRPIENAVDLHTLVEAAQTEGTRTHSVAPGILPAASRRTRRDDRAWRLAIPPGRDVCVDTRSPARNPGGSEEVRNLGRYHGRAQRRAGGFSCA